MFTIILASLVSVIWLFYYFWTYNYNHWEHQGVPYLKPSFPFGHVKELFLMRTTIGEAFDKLYWEKPDVPFVGLFRFRTPILLIRDPALVKEVLVNKFTCFHDNDYYVNPEVNPVLSINPFNAKGERWKHSREVITPSLTPAKIKSMVPQIATVCKMMNDYLNSETDYIEVIEFCGKYTTDVVAACAFGLSSNSFTNPNSEFRSASRGLFDGSYTSNFAILCALYAPKLGDIMKFKYDYESSHLKMITDTYNYRKSNGISRPDYLQTLIDANETELNKNGKPLLSNVEITGHCMTFFLDGYETAALVLAFAMYELSHEPEVQAKLRDEIMNAGTDINSFDFQTIASLQYLDCVLMETLRKHPQGTTLTRACTKTTTLKSGEFSVTVEEGTPVTLPIYSLQNDPTQFSDPKTFNPDRFTQEGRTQWHPFAFFAFGGGPRNCPGQVFALTMLKMALIMTLLQYELEPKDKSSTNLEFDQMNTFFMCPVNGLWIKFKKIAQ